MGTLPKPYRDSGQRRAEEGGIKSGAISSPGRIKCPVIPAMTYVMTLIRNATLAGNLATEAPSTTFEGWGRYEGGEARGLLPTLFGRVTNGVSSGCMVYAN